LQILIEGTQHYSNMGDVAMLQVAVQRLRGLWPQARICAITSDPERLEFYCPGVEPLFQSARNLWFDSPPVFRSKRLDEIVRRRWPLLYGRILCRELRADVLDQRLLDHFLSTLRETNLFVVAGMGSFSDVFTPGVMNMIRTIPLLKAMGARTVAFGQGMGPMSETSSLWDVSSRVLPLLDFVALREGRVGPRFLERLGVSDNRVAVTGDDAIEIAYRDDPISAPSDLLGVSLRVAKYSGVTSDDARWLGEIIASAGREHGAELVGVPTSFGPGESDLDALTTMFSRQISIPINGPTVTPDNVVKEISRLRVVVTGVYHAAVFALSQGIPVVGLVKSSYYRDKFLGLAAQFGQGCNVVDLSDGDSAARITFSIRRFWNEPTVHRNSLLKAARDQIAASKHAWADLPDRFPDLNHCVTKVSRIRERHADPVRTWYQFRAKRLDAELKKTVDYVHDLEAARDWQAERAAGAEAALKAMAEHFSQVEAARDWQAGRADRAEAALKKSTEYSSQVEDARDWHAERAARAEATLKTMSEYLAQVEGARDWHADRAARAEAMLKTVAEDLRQVEASRDWHRAHAGRFKVEPQSPGLRTRA
jgi:polysaccharide pyruvyl transferase WcaK-like protein